MADPGRSINGLACPTIALCVAVDEAGNVATSLTSVAAAPVWHVLHVNDGVNYECWHYGEVGPSCQRAFVAISCPSTALCVATDDSQGIFTSRNPATPAASWSGGGGPLPASEALTGLSCPAVRLCVATDSYGGDVWRWDPQSTSMRPLAPVARDTGLSGLWCVSAARCFAATYSGILLATPAPSGPASGWHPILHDPRALISGLACAARLCVATDGAGQLFADTAVPVGELLVRVVGSAGARRRYRSVLLVTDRRGKVVRQATLTVGTGRVLTLPVGRYTISIRPARRQRRDCRPKPLRITADTVTHVRWPAACLTQLRAR